MQNQNRFEVNRRTVVRTAAWSAPAVAVVAAAPAYATTSTEPNLSSSTMSSAPSRGTDGTVSVAPGSVTFVNTGGGAANGLSVEISVGGSGGASATAVPTTAPLGSITEVRLNGNPYPYVTGLGTSSVVLTLPAELVTIAPGASFPLSLPLDIVANDHRATTATVTVTALNGGASTSFPTLSLAALNVPNLSQSSSLGLPTRQSDGRIRVEKTRFLNVGTVATSGARVTIEASHGITAMKGKHALFGEVDLTLGGITYESGFAPGAGQKKIIFRTGASGQPGYVGCPANGGTVDSSSEQYWTIEGTGAFTFTSTIEPLNGDNKTVAPNGIGVKFVPAPIA